MRDLLRTDKVGEVVTYGSVTFSLGSWKGVSVSVFDTQRGFRVSGRESREL